MSIELHPCEPPNSEPNMDSSVRCAVMWARCVSIRMKMAAHSAKEIHAPVKKAHHFTQGIIHEVDHK